MKKILTLLILMFEISAVAQTDSISQFRIFRKNFEKKTANGSTLSIRWKYVYPAAMSDFKVNQAIMKKLNYHYFGQDCFFPAVCMEKYFEQELNSFDIAASKRIVSWKSDIRVRVTYNSPTVLSLVVYENISDIKEQRQNIKVINFDLKTGKELTKNDIFLGGTNSNLRQMLEQSIYKNWDDEDLTGIVDIPDNVYFSRKGMVFLWTKDELEVPADELLKVVEPYERLKSFLKVSVL